MIPHNTLRQLTRAQFLARCAGQQEITCFLRIVEYTRLAQQPWIPLLLFADTHACVLRWQPQDHGRPSDPEHMPGITVSVPLRSPDGPRYSIAYTPQQMQHDGTLVLRTSFRIVTTELFAADGDGAALVPGPEDAALLSLFCRTTLSLRVHSLPLDSATLIAIMQEIHQCFVSCVQAHGELSRIGEPLVCRIHQPDFHLPLEIHLLVDEALAALLLAALRILPSDVEIIEVHQREAHVSSDEAFLVSGFSSACEDKHYCSY